MRSQKSNKAESVKKNEKCELEEERCDAREEIRIEDNDRTETSGKTAGHHCLPASFSLRQLSSQHERSGEGKRGEIVFLESSGLSSVTCEACVAILRLVRVATSE